MLRLIFSVLKLVAKTRYLFTKEDNSERISPSGTIAHYGTKDPLLDQALALSHPMAFYAIHEGIASSTEALKPNEHLAQKLRPMLLHHLGLSTNLDDAAIQKQFPERLKNSWYQLDIQNPKPLDQPKASLAFACARVAFYTRCAHMIGWLNQDLHRHILLLNAIRAGQCFSSWRDFAQSYALGRQQWLKYGRADALGRALSLEEVEEILTNPEHPWAVMNWPPNQ